MSRYEQRRRRGWPYWKVQWRADPRDPWRDIQASHGGRDAAVGAARSHAASTGTHVRLMRVDRDGRQPEDV